jgi:prepilin signal peptidase PulO-like enzyme (type II secretory pathway)
MNGFFGASTADVVATWVAAIATLVVLGSLLGERRLFSWSQHLLAGLATGFLALIALTDVIGPRLVEPLAVDPGGRPELWLGVAVAAVTAAAPWLPRPLAAVPASIAIGSLAAFALGGAVVGTLLPQLDASIVRHGDSGAATVGGAVAAVITGLVLVGFLHGMPRGRLLVAAAGAGRWLLLAGIGGWLGFLLLSRLMLLVDRIGFLLGDWIGLGR